MASIENLEKLVEDCTTPSLDDDQSFQDVLLSAQEVLVMDDDRCAELFDVSRSSVNRWKNGATAPRRVVRRHVYSVLLNEAQRALKSKVKRVAEAGGTSSSGTWPMVAKS